jgi:hypothetical protein
LSCEDDRAQIRVYWTGSTAAGQPARLSLAESSEHGTGLCDTIKCDEFVDQISDFKLYEKDCTLSVGSLACE